MNGQDKASGKQKWYLIAVAVLGMLVYAGSMPHPFIFDDGAVILGNEEITRIFPLSLSPRMVADFSFSVNYALGGYRVFHYRAVNLLIHIGAALALYGLIRRTLQLPQMRNQWGKDSSELALVSAALWVVHPLQTQSVTYICQRYESLAGMLILVCMYCFVRGVSEKPRYWFDLGLLSGLLGVCVKQNVVVLPVMLIVYDWVFASVSFREVLCRRWRVHLAFVGLWGVFLFLLLIGSAKVSTAGGALFSSVSPVVYLFTQAEVILHYISLSFWPDVLCLDYGWEPVAGFHQVIAPVLIVSFLGLSTLWAIARRSKLGFLGFSFFALLAPTSSIVPLYDMAFEHRMYLPLATLIVGVVLAIHAMFARLATRQGQRRYLKFIGVCCASIAVVALSARTVLRNRDYASEERMWRNAVGGSAGNLRARNGLAVALAEKGKYEAAKREFEYMLQATEQVESAWDGKKWRPPFQMASNSPENNRFRAFVNMGAISATQGNLGSAAENYAQALRIYPYSDQVSASLRSAMIQLGASEAEVDAIIIRWLRQDASVSVSEVLR